ncbi:MAG: phosphatidylserine decarboxylase family protein [Deltaproteobacteria bacterium]|jgi:phosphatidylserine decarboxylase|nr:phosphatidylserine decarboxylase family protein [Deltaproteobacteria bacterium]
MLEDIFKAKIPYYNIHNRLPLARPGLIFILIGLIATFIFLCFGFYCLTAIFLFLTAFSAYFFRDPNRPTPPGNFGLSPCDGKVIRIEPESFCPLTGRETLKVSIFMNLFSVHVNRVPVAGDIVRQDYFKGVFFNASFDKASEKNERNAIMLETAPGQYVSMVQIAGLVARRIVSWVEPGQTLRRGQRFGMIRFGSRVDLHLPRNSEIMVTLGQKVLAGWSPIWRQND